MNRQAWSFRSAALPLFILLAMLTIPGTATRHLHAAEQEKPKAIEPTPLKVEVVITETEKGFAFKGWSLPGVPTKIIVRNEDHVTHGFTSRLFNEVPVRVEGAGVEVRGKHLRSFHLEPGHTMTIHFTSPQSKFDPSTGIAETMYYVFWCDLHPEARGEFYVVETRGEIGGG